MSLRSVHVCMDLDPAQGGLHRSICDFAACTGGDVVSVATGPGRRRRRGAGELRETSIDGGWLGGFPCRTSLPAAARRRLTDALTGYDVVVLHSLYRAHMPTAAAICRGRAIPYAVVVHGMLDPLAVARAEACKRFWMHRVGRSVLEHAAAVVFATRAERDKAVYRPTVNQSVILLPAVRAQAERIGDSGLRSQLGIPPSDRVLLYLNRFSTIKRPLETLRAFARANVPGMTLLMVGFDAEITARRLRREANRFPQARVLVLEPVTGQTKWPLLTTVDGFVSFSAKENFGYAFAESMWAGLPCIVTTGHDLLGERLERDSTASPGWVVGVDDVAGLQAAIEAFAATPTERLVTIGAGNRDWARRMLGEASFATRAQELLARIATDAPVGALAS